MDIKKHIREALIGYGVSPSSDGFVLVKEMACIAWDDGYGFEGDLSQLNRYIEDEVMKLPPEMLEGTR